MVGSDKNEVILGQYDLDIKRVYRIKGAIVLDTSDGQKIMREYRYSEGKAMLVNCIMQHMMNNGFYNVDYISRNREGHLISENQYGNRYVIKNYYPGEECNLKEEQDVIDAATSLAKIHTMLEGVDFSSVMEYRTAQEDDAVMLKASSIDDRFTDRASTDNLTMNEYDEIVSIAKSPYSERLIVPKKDIREYLNNHAKEIRRVKKYICDKKKKNDFDIEFLNCFSIFKEQPIKAVEQICGAEYDRLYEDAVKNSRVLHGEYTHHNIVYFKDEGGSRKYAITGYEKSAVGIQIYDLYRLLRKIMEKNEWDYRLGSRVVDEYIRTRRREANDVRGEELNVLYALLIFPEKLWKITDYYYNRRKSWISVRMLDKLARLKALEESRQKFIEMYEKEYIGS